MLVMTALLCRPRLEMLTRTGGQGRHDQHVRAYGFGQLSRNELGTRVKTTLGSTNAL